MNITFVCYYHLYSNSGLHVYNIANRLTEKGANCIVFVPEGKEMTYKIGNPKFNIYNFNELSAIQFNPDIVHAWTPRECVREFVEKVVERYKCPYIVHLEDNEEHLVMSTMKMTQYEFKSIQRGDMDFIANKNISHPFHYREFLSRASKVTALIDNLLEFKPENTPGCVFWPAYDKMYENLPITNEKLKSELNLNEQTKCIVYTGNVHASNQKEVFSLYLAVSLLNRRGIPTVLIRTGDDYVTLIPPELAQLNKYCIKLGFLPRKKLPSLLALADVLVQPGKPDEFNSYRFPSKLPEFLVSGKPVILPAVNIGRYLKDGEECVLLSTGEAIEIASKLEMILGNIDLGRRIGNGGRAFAKKRFDWGRSASMLLDFYREGLSVRN